MSNAKYTARNLSVSQEQLDLLQKMQTELKKRLGFAPSLSEVVVVAVTRWIAEEMP